MISIRHKRELQKSSGEGKYLLKIIESIFFQVYFFSTNIFIYLTTLLKSW